MNKWKMSTQRPCQRDERDGNLSRRGYLRILIWDNPKIMCTGYVGKSQASKELALYLLQPKKG